MKSSIILTVAAFLLATCNIKAQEVSFSNLLDSEASKSTPIDNPFYKERGDMPNNFIYQKNHTRDKLSELRPPVVRESDVAWSKRVWRTIDLNQRINLPLKLPTTPIRGRMSLYEVLVRSALIPDPPNGTLQVFGWPTGHPDFTFTERFKTTTEFINEALKYEYTNAGVAMHGYFTSEDIIRYALMEEWFFDKKRSQLDVRILALAPVAYKKNQQGQNVTNQPPKVLFYVYFPQARWFLNRHEVFNANNNSEYRTFYQIFLMRRFSSFISKEENVHDRRIAEYAVGIDALLESERIENEIQEFEFDLWEN